MSPRCIGTADERRQGLARSLNSSRRAWCARQAWKTEPRVWYYTPRARMGAEGQTKMSSASEAGEAPRLVDLAEFARLCARRYHTAAGEEGQARRGGGEEETLDEGTLLHALWATACVGDDDIQTERRAFCHQTHAPALASWLGVLGWVWEWLGASAGWLCSL